MTSLLSTVSPPSRAGRGLDTVLANRMVRAVIWCRYLAMTALCLWLAYSANVAAERRLTDWIFFEDAARTIVHYHHYSIYSPPALHLYADDPNIQIGPPAVLSVAALQWAKPATVENFFIAVMGCCGVLGLASIEAVGRRLLPAFPRRRMAGLMTLAGLPAIAAWGNWVGFWLHWDDVIALTATALAVWIIARRGSWALVGLLLGTAVASKPWAIVMAPVLLGLPRQDRAKATLAFLGVAALWWGPFVLSAPATVTSLGGLTLPMRAGSVLRLFGVAVNTSRWLRPVQFIVGAAFATWIAQRSDRAWLAAPLAGLAVRVFFDPYSYSYYGMGPVMFALLWDMTRSTTRRLPIYTFLTLTVEFGVLWAVHEDHLVTTDQEYGRMLLLSVSKLMWCLFIVGSLVWHTGQARRRESLSVESGAQSADRLDGAVARPSGAEPGGGVPAQHRQPAVPRVGSA